MQTKVSVKVPRNGPISLIMCKICLVYDTWQCVDNNNVHNMPCV